MVSRPGSLPSGPGWSYEVKWDGFRALVSTEDELCVRSRRGWDMTELLPELAALPPGLVLDGELVAWRDSDPYFPDVCARVLNRDASIPITFVAFDVLRIDGESMMDASFEERRAALVRLPLRPPVSVVAETFADGAACSTPCAGSDSKAWSRSACRAATAPVTGAGSRRRTRTTGVAMPREAVFRSRERRARTCV
jgi:bifunctional non-homologous end joining protein LigD